MKKLWKLWSATSRVNLRYPRFVLETYPGAMEGETQSERWFTAFAAGEAYFWKFGWLFMACITQSVVQIEKVFIVRKQDKQVLFKLLYTNVYWKIEFEGFIVILELNSKWYSISTVCNGFCSRIPTELHVCLSYLCTTLCELLQQICVAKRSIYIKFSSKDLYYILTLPGPAFTIQLIVKDYSHTWVSQIDLHGLAQMIDLAAWQLSQ